jgi:hypothetical protein
VRLLSISIKVSVLHHTEIKYPHEEEGPGDDGGRCAMAQEDHWLPGFNFNVEEWDAEGQNYETLAICRTLELARAAFAAAIAGKPAGRFMIRSRTRVVHRHPKGDWQR